ncbi:hypothetical protein [Brevundimonas sp.]|jgi:hypothetical protein|uniref:hypothetical protein n=1 Tax=Brevundimonas sp. TaxID=1871086 RepID=UPI003784B0DB
MAGILTFQQFIGGPDQVKCEAIFPSTQKTLQYNFGQDITGWTFEVDHQTLVVDTLGYDRYTSEPNFANSRVIGSFPKAEVPGTNITVTNAVTGLVNITIPAGMYTGPILPDARKNVPITVVGVTWKTAGSLNNINTHRWVMIQNWEPDVTAGDPVLSTNPVYTAIGA